jgi:hypothetical protein
MILWFLVRLTSFHKFVIYISLTNFVYIFCLFYYLFIFFSDYFAFALCIIWLMIFALYTLCTCFHPWTFSLLMYLCHKLHFYLEKYYRFFIKPLGRFALKYSFLYMTAVFSCFLPFVFEVLKYTVMCHLQTRVCSEKCAIRWFCPENFTECTYTNLKSIRQSLNVTFHVVKRGGKHSLCWGCWHCHAQHSLQFYSKCFVLYIYI